MLVLAAFCSGFCRPQAQCRWLSDHVNVSADRECDELAMAKASSRVTNLLRRFTRSHGDRPGGEGRALSVRCAGMR
jgi:hypothetical protein